MLRRGVAGWLGIGPHLAVMFGKPCSEYLLAPFKNRIAPLFAQLGEAFKASEIPGRIRPPDVCWRKLAHTHDGPRSITHRGP